MTAISPRASGYSHAQYADSYPTGIAAHWWHLTRIGVVRRIIDQSPRSTILDVGCGPGLTVDALRRLGYDCWGCEIAEPPVVQSVAPFVKTKADARELNSAFRSKVEVILLLDVLEHLERPEAFLFSLVQSYPVLRTVIITVPARTELWSVWDELYGHFRRYDRPALRKLVDQANLHPVKVRYFFNSIYPALFVTSKMGIRGNAMKSPRRTWLHKALSKVLSLEASIPGIGNLPGTSLLAVGEPSHTAGPGIR